MTEEQKTKANLPRRWLYIVLSMMVTVGVFYYLFSHVSFAEIRELVLNADRGGVMMFILCSFAMSIARAWRFAVVLGVSDIRPPRMALFLIVLVRNLFSDLLPARVGTLVYVYLARARLGIPMGPALSSFALSFVFDLVAIAPMIFAALLFLGDGAELSVSGLVISAVVLLVITIGVLVLLEPGARFGARIVQRLRMVRLSDMLTDMADEVRTARQHRVYDKLFLLSLAVRGFKYASLYFFLFALLAPRGYSLAELKVPSAFMGFCAAEMAASLPISGIAGFGAYEGAWALVFRLLGFPASIADLTAVAHHLFTQVWGYGLGGLALLLLLIPARRKVAPAKGEATEERRDLSFYLKYLLLILLAGSGLVALYLLTR